MTMYCWIRSKQLARREGACYIQVHEDVSRRTLDLEVVEVLQPPEDEAAETNFPRDDSATRVNIALENEPHAPAIDNAKPASDELIRATYTRYPASTVDRALPRTSSRMLIHLRNIRQAGLS